MPDSDLDQLLRLALHSIGEPIFLIGLENRCIFTNRAFQTLFQLNTDSVKTEDFWPHLCVDDLQQPELCTELKLSGGQRLSVNLHIQPLALSGDVRCHLVRVLSGFSKTQAQDALHAERLETLGMLASGIAHDFNNILAGILGHVTYLKTILPARGPHAESLLSIVEGAKKATGMTQQILKFSKAEDNDEACEIELSDLVVRTIKLLRGAITPDISIDFDIPNGELMVLGAEGKIAQVLVNVVINARDALLDNGLIKVSLTREERGPVLNQVFHLKELPCDAYVRLKVCDNGRGMSKEVMDHMFEPYFTTKHGKGSGLGLATVKSIVQQLGGAILVDSQVGVGTEVNVYLPLVEPKSVPVSKARGELSGVLPALSNERILIVDDETPVRNVLSISLQHLGYRVDTAASGLEALQKYSEGGEPFGLVILDMLMPNLSGERVFLKLREMDPSARVMLISGYTSEEAVKRVLESGGLDFIQKPFTIEELSKRVRHCFEQR